MSTARKYLLFAQVFLALTAGIACVVFLAVTIREVRESSTEFRGNLTHYASQVNYELFQLIEHINRYVQDDVTVTRQDLTTRLDVLWSRLDESTIGGRGRLYLALPGGRELATETLRKLEEIEPVLDTLERDDYEIAAFFLDDLRRLVGRSRAVSDAALTFDASRDAGHLEDDLRNSIVLILVIVTVFAFILLSIFQSWREIRRSGQLNEELERRVSLRTVELEEMNAQLETEVTERAQAERRYRSLVDHATEAIVILDVDQGAFVEANPRAEALYGVPRDELISSYGLQDLNPAFQPDGRPSDEAAMAYINEALEGDYPSFEWMHRSVDGVDVPCSVSLARFPDPKRRLVRGSLIDLSDRKNAEASQAELEKQLAQAQKLETIGQMTGGVAHDFNNLLSVVLGNLELLEETAVDREQRELIEAAKNASMRGAALTRSMLNFARRANLQPQKISLSELVHGMDSWMSRTISATIKVRTSFKPDLWSIVADVV